MLGEEGVGWLRVASDVRMLFGLSFGQAVRRKGVVSASAQNQLARLLVVRLFRATLILFCLVLLHGIAGLELDWVR